MKEMTARDKRNPFPRSPFPFLLSRTNGEENAERRAEGGERERVVLGERRFPFLPSPLSPRIGTRQGLLRENKL